MLTKQQREKSSERGKNPTVNQLPILSREDFTAGILARSLPLSHAVAAAVLVWSLGLALLSYINRKGREGSAQRSNELRSDQTNYS